MPPVGVKPKSTVAPPLAVTVDGSLPVVSFTPAGIYTSG